MLIDRRTMLRGTAALAAGKALGLVGPRQAKAQEPGTVRVRIWSEGTAPASVYPEGIDGALASALERHPSLQVQRARLADEEAGLSDASLEATDVLVWWGRFRHEDVPDGRVQAIVDRVRAGRLGFIALHASCLSKPFRSLMGGRCDPGSWHDDGRPEHVSIASPDHPIVRGISPFTIPRSTMFSEPFDVPEPEDVVFLSTWEGGESFRSGLTWSVGEGRTFYFRPGHDSYPVMFHPQVRQVIANASLWAAPAPAGPASSGGGDG